jgi:hypothetical protein
MVLERLARKCGSAILLALFLSCDTPSAWGQGQLSTATLTGQVTDQSGAAIPGVGVTAISTTEGSRSMTLSNDLGYYTFPVLRPGAYNVTAKKTGMADVQVADVTLRVGQVINIDLAMKPGTVTEQVTVQASGAVLETQNATLGVSVADTKVQELPIILRDATALVNFVPGITADHRSFPSGDVAAGQGLLYTTRLDFSINGGMRNSAAGLVDGIDVSFVGGNFNAMPLVVSPDFTQEVAVHTNNVSAEYGRAAGVVNIVTKSGTNTFHGSVYEFLQNDKLNANDWFANRAGQGRPSLKRNQYGYALGGPIAKDKLFFFTDFEQLRQTKFQGVTTRVPTAAEKAGNFSGLYNTAGVPVTIYNPFDTTTGANGVVQRRPFPNNQIPQSLFDPFATKIASYYPSPNNAGLLAPGGLTTNVGNLVVAGSAPLDYDRFDAKGDYNMGSAHRIMARFSRGKFTGAPLEVFHNIANPPGLSQRLYGEISQNAVLSWNWTVSPTLVVTQALNFTRSHNTSDNATLGFDVSSLGGPFATNAIANFVNTWTGGTAFPSVSVTGYSPVGSAGATFYYNQVMSSYVYQPGLVKLLGRHTLKAGFQYALHQQAELYGLGFSGAYTFGGSFSAGANPLVPTANTGNGFADMLLGLPSAGSMTTGSSVMLSSKYYAWYLQDDFRISNKLTLNIGLRYDFETPASERFGHKTRFDMQIPNPIGSQRGANTAGQTLDQYFQNLTGQPVLGGLVFPSTPGYGNSVAKTDSDNWAPRVGAAYRLSDKLVLRGGFSRLYSLSPGVASLNFGAGTGSASTSLIGSIDGINPNVTIKNPFPNGFNTPIFDSQQQASLLGQALQLQSTNNKTPYQWQWNFGLQYALSQDSVATISYAGARGRRLLAPAWQITDQISQSLIQKYQGQVFDQVANPFYGIITDQTSILSRPTVQRGQLLKQWPQFANWTNTMPAYQGPGDDAFKSSWNALEVGVQKRFSSGLSAMLAYTFSKNLNNTDGIDGGYGGPASGYQNTKSFDGERSLSIEDVPQRLVLGSVYSLPFGKGKRYGAKLPVAADKLVGGWQVSGIMTLQKGFPLPVSVAGVTTGAFGGGVRPNLVGNPCGNDGRSRNDRVNSYLNPAGFQAQPNFQFGNAPRTLGCRTDGVKNLDFSAVKITPITERFNLEFRSEFFNVFNRVQLGYPNTQFQGASFGRITSAYNQPRQIQLALKLNF